MGELEKREDYLLDMAEFLGIAGAACIAVSRFLKDDGVRAKFSNALDDALELIVEPRSGRRERIAAARRRPELEGVVPVGPEAFADRDETVISWKGENYYAAKDETSPAPESGERPE